MKKILIAVGIVLGLWLGVHLYIDHQNFHTLTEYVVMKSQQELKAKKALESARAPIDAPTPRGK